MGGAKRKQEEEDDDELCCTVCYEPYQQQGDHVPRLFPCSHTVCHKCVKGMIDTGDLKCPTCRRSYKGRKFFPENTYILKMLKYIERSEADKFSLCKVHSRDLSLFCKEQSCQAAICQVCHLVKHENHQVVDILEEHVEKLDKRVEILSKKRLAKMLALKTDESTLDKLLRKKNDFNKKFDEMIDCTRAKITETETCVGNLETDMKKMSDMKTRIKEKCRESEQERKTIENLDLTEEGKIELCKVFLENTPKDAGRLVDHLVDLPQYKLTEKFRFPEHRTVLNMQLLSDGTLAVYSENQVDHSAEADSENRSSKISQSGKGKDDSKPIVKNEAKGQKERFLAKYNIRGAKVFEVRVAHRVEDIAEVTLNKQPSLAMSYHWKNIIEFRDMNNWSKVIYIHTFDSAVPTRLCTSSPTTLLFADESEDPIQVKELKCGTMPVICTDTSVEFDDKELCDILHLNHHGGQSFLVAQCKSLELYDFNSGQLKWIAKGMVPGNFEFRAQNVTTDGHGLLFVADYHNDHTYIFTTKGRYIGLVDPDDKFSLYSPYALAWNDKTSSLIVQHGIGDEDAVAVIQLKM